MTRNRILMTCAIASLALGLSACSSDDDVPLAMVTPEVTPEEPTLTPAEMLAAAQTRVDAAQEAVANLADDATPEQAGAAATELRAAELALTEAENLPDNLPVPPTELEKAQAAAAAAATGAMTAAGAAGDAAEAADKARENAATIQTNGTSGDHAYMARKYAKMAQEAYETAKTASAAVATAVAAEDLVAAVEARVAAESAMADAVTAKDEAVIHADLSKEAAAKELFVDGDTYWLGDKSVTVSEEATTTATRDTGKLDNDLTTPGVRDANGRPIMFGDPAEMVEGRTATTPTIGNEYDSVGDDARVTLITHYLGSQKQMQFVRFSEAADNPFVGAMGARLLPSPGDASYDVMDGKIEVDLDGVGPDGASMVAPSHAGSFVSALDTDETVPLYYVDLEAEGTPTPDDGIDQTKLFLERNTDDGEVSYKQVNVVEVTVDNPRAYKYIAFGLWTDLGGTGSNTLEGLGVAFVNGLAIMTEVMPNHGTADYNGDWVANVQAAAADGNGGISRMNGGATLGANFRTGKVTATLDGLATLTGEISEDKINTFSGKAATVMAGFPHGLDAAADFEGALAGAFFGDLAAEAGGVFDFAATEDVDNDGGAFRGAFGGAKLPQE